MLTRGRIPMTDEETALYEALLEEHDVRSATRRDPNNTGPLVVELVDGTTLIIDTTEED